MPGCFPIDSKGSMEPKQHSAVRGFNYNFLSFTHRLTDEPRTDSTVFFLWQKNGMMNIAFILCSLFSLQQFETAAKDVLLLRLWFIC